LLTYLLAYPRWGQPEQKPGLFGRVIIVEELQPMWSRYINVT